MCDLRFNIIKAQVACRMSHVYMLSIYIHIPYCLKKCAYCDFYSVPASGGSVPEGEYLRACLEQLRRESERNGLKGRDLTSIYFGGGTPSILSPDFFKRMLDEIEKTLSVVGDIEISCEVNPATVDEKWFFDVKKIGINRISIGVQSFNSKLLKILGRVHSSEDAMRTIAEAQDVGFKSIGLDLMYGIPSETILELEDDIRTAMTFQPEHISAYQLTVEDDTPLKVAMDRSEIKLPSDEASLKQMRIVARMLDRVGWNRYEISNYAKSGFESKHNMNYWNYGEYLGVGAGATSFIRSKGECFGRRYARVRDVKQFIEGIVRFDEDEILDVKTAMSEFMFMGLRMIDGVDPDSFKELFGKDLYEVYGETLAKLVDDDLLRKVNSKLCLTPKGIEISNYVFEKFI